jgi:hypothetical protein
MRFPGKPDAGRKDGSDVSEGGVSEGGTSIGVEEGSRIRVGVAAMAGLGVAVKVSAGTYVVVGSRVGVIVLAMLMVARVSLGSPAGGFTSIGDKQATKPIVIIAAANSCRFKPLDLHCVR